MSPFLYLLLTAIIIILTGYAVWRASNFSATMPVAPMLLFAWLWFNLFIAAYEFYIVYKRRSLAEQECPRDFWGTPTSADAADFWLRAWLEYTCYSDTRYLDPNDTVFYIEGLNAILVVLMWGALLTGSYPLLMYLLILQAANCVFYFVSLYKSGKINAASPTKLTLYLLMSSLWVFAPLYLVLSQP